MLEKILVFAFCLLGILVMKVLLASVFGKQRIHFKEFTEGSTQGILEAVEAMKLGKLRTFGYRKAARYCRKVRGSYLRPVHYVWLITEANLAGKTDRIEKDFPNAWAMAMRVLWDIKGFLPDMFVRVSRPDWRAWWAILPEHEKRKIKSGAVEWMKKRIGGNHS